MPIDTAKIIDRYQKAVKRYELLTRHSYGAEWSNLQEEVTKTFDLIEFASDGHRVERLSVNPELEVGATFEFFRPQGISSANHEF